MIFVRYAAIAVVFGLAACGNVASSASPDAAAAGGDAAAVLDAQVCFGTSVGGAGIILAPAQANLGTQLSPPATPLP